MPRLTSIHWRRLVCVFERDGFTVIRQEGDHIVLAKPGCKRPLVIPQWPEVPVFIIRNHPNLSAHFIWPIKVLPSSGTRRATPVRTGDS